MSVSLYFHCHFFAALIFSPITSYRLSNQSFFNLQSWWPLTCLYETYPIVSHSTSSLIYAFYSRLSSCLNIIFNHFLGSFFSKSLLFFIYSQFSDCFLPWGIEKYTSKKMFCKYCHFLQNLSVPMVQKKTRWGIDIGKVLIKIKEEEKCGLLGQDWFGSGDWINIIACNLLGIKIWIRVTVRCRVE